MSDEDTSLSTTEETPVKIAQERLHFFRLRNRNLERRWKTHFKFLRFLQVHPTRWTYRSTSRLQTSSLYEAIVFSESGMLRLVNELSEITSSKRSQWYGRIDNIKTITLNMPLNPLRVILGGKTTNAIYPFHYITIMPVQLCHRDFLCVHEEFCNSILDFHDVIQLKREWFQTRHHFKATRSSTAQGAETSPSPSPTEYVDEEAGTQDDVTIPTVYVSPRVSELTDGKVRRIGVQDIMSCTIRAVAPGRHKQPKHAALVLRLTDANQLGLTSLGSATVTEAMDNGAPEKYVRIQVKVSDLREFVEHIQTIDDNIFDVLIHLNDYKLSERGDNLNLQNITTTSLYHERSLDVDLLIKVIKEADQNPSDLSDGSVRSAAEYIIKQFNERGYSSEEPRKLVHFSQCTFHSARLSWAERGPSEAAKVAKTAERAFKASVDANAAVTATTMMTDAGAAADAVAAPTVPTTSAATIPSMEAGRDEFVAASVVSSDVARKAEMRAKLARTPCYRPFRRNVRTVSNTGYRVRQTSTWMWMSLIIGAILPVVYVVLRYDKASFEDLISTATSIVGLYVLIVSPTIFQVCYRGEKLIDVLSNMRDIDTQDEFTDRGDRQTTDILEVLRLSSEPPPFLGGRNSNSSYVPNFRPEMSFHAKEPMAFPSLDLIGFGLFENEKGDLFLLDSWSRMQEVFLLDKSRSEVDAFPNRPEQNYYKSSLSNMSSCSIKLTDLTLRCNPVKETDQAANQSSESSGMEVSYQNAEGGVKTERISRVLPFGVRFRCVEMSRERWIRSVRFWREIQNEILLSLDVGG